ncbi:hypothetical protein DPMN_104255 [Dreissena polymorpha]|uniref:Uncharacterized protein n=1 Tax=Dreissena polymorpha TaxID=45954 RepID=A0A9D4HCP8_DREPO|nr:hypothetical protein DPMN_104255 [Dreissena polymorpha]
MRNLQDSAHLSRRIRKHNSETSSFHYIHIEKNAPPTGGHVFSPIWTIFELVRDINKTNLLTNFHDDWAKIETNVLTKFHENWAKNVTSRVFTCFHYIHIEKNVPPTGGHVFFFIPIWTIFELVREINKTNVLTNFHDDWAKIVTSRPNKENCPPTGGHIFQRTETTFEHNQHIIKTNILTHFKLNRDFIGKKLLTKFHEDRTINVASRVFTNKCGRTDRRRTKTGHKSSPEQSDFFKINILTKFHKDWMKNVTSIVYTRFHQDKHSDQISYRLMKNVTSTVYTNKLLTDTRTHIRTLDITRSHKLTMSLPDR